MLGQQAKRHEKLPQPVVPIGKHFRLAAGLFGVTSRIAWVIIV